jgi:putative ABC transport system permease protein
MLQDIRYGLRMLLKTPAFTLIAVLTLALGIGANTAIFSVIQAVLLQPLPFPRQDRLVMLWKQDTTSNTPFVELAIREVKDWQDQSRTFESFATLPATSYGYGYILTGRGEAVQLESAKVSGRFFSLLGVKPAYGRVLSESDDIVGSARVAVLSDHAWRQYFNADPAIVGQTITLTEQGFTVVGVMPPQFEFPRDVDIWVPLSPTMSAAASENRGITFLRAVGRLKPGVTVRQAEAEMNTLVARIAADHPETHAAGHRIVIIPLTSFLFGDARPALWLLLAATAMLLLVATANIASLSLARASARRREFAMRAALGARSLRLVRQLLTESLLLALGGGLSGVLLAQWFIKFLVALAPSDIPQLDAAGLNLTVLLFTLATTVLAAILCGLAPALTASRTNLNQTLSEGSGKISGARSGQRTRAALVIAEVAVTVVLLVGSSLILRSFINLSSVDLGFKPANVLTMHLRLQGAKYGKADVRRGFFRQLIANLEAQPGIEAASAVLIRPMEGIAGWDTPFTLEGQSVAEAQKNRIPNFEAISPHYFRTFRIPIKAGREFNEHDTEQTPRVAIISETMARTLFKPGSDPIGRRLRLGTQPTDDPSWCTIVGIAADARYRELADVRFDLYVPLEQWPGAFANHFAVRTTGEPLALLSSVRRELDVLDPTQALTRVATMDQLVAANLARSRFSAVLLSCLSGLALLLAAIGIYGLLAYTISLRSGEIGIRLALGAQPRDIWRLVAGQGMRLVVAGLVLGIAASFALTRLLAGLLFNVSTTDPVIFGGVALLLIVIALLTCYAPARKAGRIDPLAVLRGE